MIRKFRGISYGSLVGCGLVSGAALWACSASQPHVALGAPRRATYAAAPASQAMEAAPGPLSREQYEHVEEHAFISALSEPLSTFAVDVDTASYANVRRFLTQGALPPSAAVRVEELLNYFEYDYPEPRTGEPVAIYSEVGDCPWNAAHKLLHVGIRARSLASERVPPRNLVFLLDVSGSMEDEDKLPLLKKAFAALTGQLRREDKVAVVVYAGSEGLVLPLTSGADKAHILEALDELSAGGSTNGGAGIELAYRVAQEGFVRGGINRVILATDGDFNVGTTSQGELVSLIERERESGVFLTVLGFGSGNLQDHTMESLADHGNGNYAYLDSLREAEKVLVREAGSTLVTVARDVKVQVELNPAQVAQYRLVGYENRALANDDFANDRKDAGDMGANDSVTALYELVPAHGDESARTLRYQGERVLTAQAAGDELATVSVRYQAPQGSASELLSMHVPGRARPLAQTSDSFRFAAAVAGFGMLLRESPHAGNASLNELRILASTSLADDPHGDRRELVALIDRARSLRRD